jgi:hypothetical protein
MRTRYYLLASLAILGIALSARAETTKVDYSKVAWSPTPSPSPWTEWKYDPKVNNEKTWKYVEELTPEELEYWQIDARWNHETPRDKEFPWLPEERYPFKPPYSGEKLAALYDEYNQTGMCNVLAHYGYHISRTMNRQGVMTKSDALCFTAKKFRTFAQDLYEIKSGEIEGYWAETLLYPPENEGMVLFSTWYHATPNSTKQEDRWLYLPTLRRVRRFSGASGEDYPAGSTLTYDDIFLRNFWKYESKIIGVDILYEAANTKQPYGPIEGPYRKDGGVEVYVVLNVHKMPGYYLKQWITYHDRKSLHVLRYEQWDKNGNLKLIGEESLANKANYFGNNDAYLWQEAMKGGLSPGGTERRGMLMGAGPRTSWDVQLDLRTYGLASGPETGIDREKFGDYSIIPESWESFFSPQRIEKPYKSQKPTVTFTSADFPPRPSLYRDKFPKYREIVLPSELQAKIKQDELAKRGLFTGTEKANN